MDYMIGVIGDVMKNNKRASDHEKKNEIMFSWWEKINFPVHCSRFLFPILIIMTLITCNLMLLVASLDALQIVIKKLFGEFLKFLIKLVKIRRKGACYVIN